MNEKDLMHALSDLDPDLLEEETVVRRFKPSRILLVAAIIALLAIPVYAVLNTVDIVYSDIQLENQNPEYYGTESTLLDFSHMEVFYQTEAVKLPPEVYATIQEWVTDDWARQLRYTAQQGQEMSQSDYNICRTYYVTHYGYEFRCLRDIEAFLGIDLCLSDAIYEANEAWVQNNDVELSMFPRLTLYTGSTQANMESHNERGIVDPIGILIRFDFTFPGVSEDDTCYSYIRIPLTRQGAELFATDTLVMYQKEGEPQEEEFSSGGVGIKLISGTPELGYNGWIHSFYSCNGIAYQISVQDKGGDSDAKDNLMSLLRDLQ